MTRSTFLFALMGMALLLSACEGFGGPKLDVQTFNLEYRAGYEAAELIGPYVFTDREANPGTMSATEDALTVRETRDNLEKIQRVLDQFDQPIPGIRLYFQLIEADSFQEEDPAIAEVVEELRGLFRYQGYRLLGEAVVPVAGGNRGRQQFSQGFLGVENPIKVEASVNFLRTGNIRLDPVELSDTWDKLMTTSVIISPGQTIVLGGVQARTEMIDGRRSGRTVLILTVRAEEE